MNAQQLREIERLGMVRLRVLTQLMARPDDPEVRQMFRVQAMRVRVLRRQLTKVH